MALEIVGWFISPVVSNIYDSIRSFFSGRYQNATDVKRALQNVENNLKYIKPVMQVIESKMIEEDRNVASWLTELKDVVYEAEDIIDAFNCESLCHGVEASGNFLRNAAKRLRTAIAPPAIHHELSDIAHALDRLLSTQSSTYLEVMKVITDSNKKDGSSKGRQTSPIPTEPMFGREREKNRLHELVLESSDENGSNSQNFSVVCIVGLGGVGKTALAQWLYNCKDVRKHFNHKAWVWVSNEFESTKVMIKILESADFRPTNQDLYKRINLGTIYEDLSRKLRGKKFLFVLDDVWEDLTTTEWKKLISVFRHCKKGSKIVITTRTKEVADLVNSKATTIDLACFGKKEYWQFFKRCAFGNVNPKDHPELKHIGKQIASKMGGLPLAAIVVGSFLNRCLKESFWRNVLESKQWLSKQWPKGGEILPSLKLSYNHLPPHLQKCFVYCALFPKNYVFKSIDKLVHLWEAQEFVESDHGIMTLEDRGREYFNELHSRSFFQDNSPGKGYVIHALLCDLAKSKSRDEIFRVKNGSSVEHRIPKRVRHLYVSSSNLDRALDQIEEPKRLRSLVYDPPHTSSISQTSRPDFKEVKRLRVLIFGEHYSSSHLPETIGNMIHLRYLEFPFGTKLPVYLRGFPFSGTGDIDDEYLPDNPNYWFSPFTNREEIDDYQLIGDSKSMFHCSNDQTSMSKIFGKLTNLSYINAPCSFISSIPSIGRLTSLQRLSRYEVREHEGYKICELRNLNKLQGCLRIDNLENVTNKEEAKKAELHNKVHLEVLSLCWRSYDCSRDEFRVEEVLEELQPHSKIKGIDISRYMGRKHPSWFNKSYLPKIEAISLFECGGLEALPPLGQLPFLKFLSLNSLMSLKTIGLEAYGGGYKVFPTLRLLKLLHLKNLREWSSFKEDVCHPMMPLLSKLEIIGCNNLEALPPLGGLQCLKHLVLEKLDLLTKIETKTKGGESTVLPKLDYLKLSSMKELKEWLAPDNGQSLMLHLTTMDIINCPNLKVIPSLGALPSLKNLHLEGLDLLEEIDSKIYGHEKIAFPSLESLFLFDLEKLKKLSSFKEDVRDMMPHLSTLQITECNKLEALPSLGGLPSLKRLHLEGLDLLEEIDSKIYGHEKIAFPSLESLFLFDLKKLKKWSSFKEDVRDMMPLLSKLEIRGCNNLEALPPLGGFQCLEHLVFKKLDSLTKIETKPKGGESTVLPKLDYLKLSSMKELKEWLAPDNGQSLMPHLTTMDITNCPNLKVIPSLGALPSLKDLHLERLDLLEEIDSKIYSHEKNAFPSLESLLLFDLKKLKKWSSFKEDVRDMMPHLSSLEISRCNKLEALPPLGGLQFLEELSLNQLDSLRKIGIEIYGRESTVFPKLQYLSLSSMKELKEWLAPDNGQSLMLHLTFLNIRNCPNLKVIPPLGALPSLKDLHLEGLDVLEEIGIEIYGRERIVFPLLTFLRLIDLKELKKWSSFKEDVGDMMPHLSRLEIIGCNKLEALPSLGGLPSLKDLHLQGLDLLEEIDSKIYGHEKIAFPSLESLFLFDLKKLKKWSSFKEDVRDMMPLLSKLEIIGCNNLVALPPLGGLQCLKHLVLEKLDSLTKIETKTNGGESTVLPKLDYLKLSSMKELKEWLAPDNGQSLMLHLTTLHIINCPNLKVILPLGALPSLKDLHLEGLDLLEEIDSKIYGHEKNAFPSLESLFLFDLKKLKKWSCFKEDVHDMMPHLSRLKISRCNKLEALPPLGGFQCLEHLALEKLDSLTKIETKTKGGESTVLPKLEYLMLSSMKELKEWLAPDNGQSLMLHLSFLNIINCPNLKVIPPLGALPSLKYLHLEGLDLLEEIDSKIYGHEKNAFPSLESLSLVDLKKLKKWSSFKEDVCDMMPHLLMLKISRCNKLEALPPLGGLQCLEHLFLNQLDSLRKIGIEIYGRESTVFPKLKGLLLYSMKELNEWLAPDDGQSLMPHVTELCIVNCPNLKVIPPLQELPSLEGLTLEGLDLLEEIGIEIYGRHSHHLQYLNLDHLKKLKKWSGRNVHHSDRMAQRHSFGIIRRNKLDARPSFKVVHIEGLDSLEEIGIAAKEQGRDLMPYLKRWKILDCHKLRRSIHVTSYILEFGFSETVDGMQMFHEIFPVGTLTCLIDLSLGPLKGLESFTVVQQEWFQSLTSLRYLSFVNCSDLRSLPNVLGSLCHLEKLFLIDCPEMLSLGLNSLPKNLTDMTIERCGELGKLCDWRQDGREWSKISHIPRIYIENEVIPNPSPAQCSRGAQIAPVDLRVKL